MAYTNIEAGGNKFRVLYAKHNGVTAASQLPVNSTCVLTEIHAHEPELIYRYLDGSYQSDPSIHRYARSRDSNVYQIHEDELTELRQKAKTEGIPLGTLEPLSTFYGDVRGFLAPASDSMFFKGPQNALGRFLAYLIHNSSSEVSQDSFVFKSIEKMALDYERIHHVSGFHLRNLVMAQMAMAFIVSQPVKESTDSINILNIGLMHIGIIKALQMDSSERSEQIRNDPDFATDFYKKTHRHVGYFVIYDKTQREWKRYKYWEPSLRKK